MVINFEVHSTVIKRPPLRNYGGTNSSLSVPRCQVAPQTREEMFTMAFKILACPGLQSTNGPRIRLTQETLPELLNIRDQRVAFLETMKAPRWHNRPPFTERKLLPKDIHLRGAAVHVICKDIPSHMYGAAFCFFAILFDPQVWGNDNMAKLWVRGKILTVTSFRYYFKNPEVRLYPREER